MAEPVHVIEQAGKPRGALQVDGMSERMRARFGRAQNQHLHGAPRPPNAPI